MPKPRARRELDTYNANGNKVEENVSGTTHEYVSAFGVTAQMTGQAENSTIVPLPGGVQALYYGGTLKRFRYPDWQGSIRAESNASPTNRVFTESLAFAPFGERYALKGAPFNVDSFTGKPDQLVPDEYDFPAREEHNGQGRWVSPDPMRGTGNKYVYADNNPLSKVDLYGLYTTVGTVNAGFQAWLNAELAQADPLLESRGPTSMVTGAAVFGASENAYLARVDSAFEGDISVETPPVLQYKQAQASQTQGQPVQEEQDQNNQPVLMAQNQTPNSQPDQQNKPQPDIPQEIKDIHSAYDKKVDEMTKNGERIGNGPANNIVSAVQRIGELLGITDHHLCSCNEQAEKISNSLNVSDPGCSRRFRNS